MPNLMQIISIFLKLQAVKQSGPGFLAYPVGLQTEGRSIAFPNTVQLEAEPYPTTMLMLCKCRRPNSSMSASPVPM